MIIDKLFQQVANKGHVCVGLDTDFAYLPDTLKQQHANIEDAIFAFNTEIIQATLDVVACYKVQIAYYEALGVQGMRCYQRTLDYLRLHGAIVIADIKRGDIAKTAEVYARAHFTGDFEADFITVNPYMGLDTISPYIPYIQNNNKGIFALLRTSNAGSKDIECLLTDKGQRVCDTVGRQIAQMGESLIGSCGYSALGGVVGCTFADEAKEMRKNLPTTFFLIPGYGAQGGKAEDIALCLHKGNGGVVNASRSILLAYKKIENGESNFAECARNEAIRMKNDILNAII